ncbi:WbqC family protein [Thiomicrorhabdus sp.]|uniref:WbqC family protein n=1 Tax=Thiomicrorhabdus sp. TaxID=2039724 RepID=UPI002AA665AB|nr:WbqC family protein [Thiomicrorhabdus sp.]
MKVAIMQPYLFPYIGYWQLINAVEQFVIFDDVNFIKKGFINRNNILVDAEPKRFTLQLVKASQNKLINETEVGENASEILKLIEINYQNAPYYQDVFPILKDILMQNEKNLARFIGYSLFKLSEYMGIYTHFIYSSQIEKNNTLKSQDKIIEICKKMQATEYVNAIGGRSLYESGAFRQNGLELYFLESLKIEYKQFQNEFVPNLSIIDILMFNDKSNIKHALNNYSLTN